MGVIFVIIIITTLVQQEHWCITVVICYKYVTHI